MPEIRPNDLQTFIGQQEAVAQLKVAVRAAKHMLRPLPHMLFQGPPGLAKTTLAYSVLPTEVGRPAVYVNCAAVLKPQDLLPTLSARNEGDIVVLDEIHLLGRVPQMTEHLLTIMEDSRLSISLGEGKELINVDLPKYTILGTTTRPGQLSQPLLDRFRRVLQLVEYSDEDMAAILRWTAEKRSAKFVGDAADILVPACQGTARYAVRLVELAIEVSCAYDYLQLTPDACRELLKMEGIIGGLYRNQQAYLRILSGGGVVGLQAMAAALNEEPQTVELLIEPHLLRRELVHRTPSGRKISDKGLEWMTSYSPRGKP